MMIELKQFKCGEVGYNEIQDYIHVSFSKLSKSVDFRAMWNFAIYLLDKYYPSQWFINEKMLSVMPEDRHWQLNDWFEQSLSIKSVDPENPRYIAMILADNFFMEISAKIFKEKLNMPGLVIKEFEEEDEAKEWLKINSNKTLV